MIMGRIKRVMSEGGVGNGIDLDWRESRFE